jgi:hypothetical protein
MTEDLYPVIVTINGKAECVSRDEDIVLLVRGAAGDDLANLIESRMKSQPLIVSNEKIHKLLWWANDAANELQSVLESLEQVFEENE